MKISTKGRYALRLMLDVALHSHGAAVPLRDVAQRQEISEKYLESIIRTLVKAKVVESLRGKGGGYRLTRKPQEYTLGEILRLTEGSLAPVACVEEHGSECPNRSVCPTPPVWQKLDALINNFLDSITLADLMAPQNTKESS